MNPMQVADPGFPRGVYQAHGVLPYYYRPQRSSGKVIFSQTCVILLTGERSASVYAGMPPPYEQTPPPPRTRPTTKGEIEGDQVQAHSQGGN